MTEKRSYQSYIKELFNLAMPMIIGNLGIILIGAGDVFVAARHSTNSLAEISIATSITSLIFLFGVGLLVSVSPLLSNFRGARQEIKKYFIPTINFAMIISVLSAVAVIICIPLMDKLNFDPILVPSIKKYMLICAFSTFGAYLQVALKEYLQAFEIVMLPNLLNIFCVFLNIYLCFVFAFGWYGLPEMGAVGIGIATLIARTVSGLILLLYCLKFVRIRYYKDYGYFVNLLKMGVPIAIAILLEVGAFNLITIFIAKISGVYAAAQSILLTITTATFMIPMAISNAIAVKVGFANGAGNITDLKKYSFSGIFVSVFFMAICAFCFILAPKFFIEIFTKDLTLVNICIPILILAGFFQIFDGLQVSLGGVFKGLKKTNIVMMGNFTAYWLIGLPLGFVLAFNYHMKLYGFWTGLTVSIFLLGIVLLLILLNHFRIIKKRAD